MARLNLPSVSVVRDFPPPDSNVSHFHQDAVYLRKGMLLLKPVKSILLSFGNRAPITTFFGFPPAAHKFFLGLAVIIL